MSGSARSSAQVNIEQLLQNIEQTAHAHSLEEQVVRVVEQLRQALGVDVCSLYQADESDTLHMVANIGLINDPDHRIHVQVGDGLVGQIAQTRLPINTAAASEHAAYHYFPGSLEECFQAFLGVPILALGRLIGVLVVQSNDPRGFTDADETLLLTVATRLADSMLRLPLSPTDHAQKVVDRRVTGIRGGGGKKIGFLHLIAGGPTLEVIEDPCSRGREQELDALRLGIKSTLDQLQVAKTKYERELPADVVALFDFYTHILVNDQLVQDVEKKIDDGLSAFAATRTIIDDYVAKFAAIEDEYLRARQDDVKHVGHQLLSNILGQSGPVSVNRDLVLIGQSVSVADISQYDLGQLAGVICFGGSAFSHTTVLARALGIPCVVGTGRLDHISEGDLTVVDGDAGVVVLNPSAATCSSYESELAASQRFDKMLLADKSLPCTTTDGKKISLLANTGLLTDINPGKERGAEGIGLYRSEIPFLSSSAFPTEAEQYEQYTAILAAYAPLPVTMRTLDIGGDKQLPYFKIAEENPALGWRGIRFSLDNRAIFVTQLRAMLRAHQLHGNLRLMFPMVSTVAEVREIMTILGRLCNEVAPDGSSLTLPPVGVMVEVPGIIPLLPHLAQWLDFVSVGTNDLTQYLLAADRTNTQILNNFDFLHPAVLHALQNINKIARTAHLDISVCGEMAADPLAAILLVGMGYESLSMNAQSLPRIKAILRKVAYSQCRRMIVAALKEGESSAIRASVTAALAAIGAGELLAADVAFDTAAMTLA